MSGLCLLASSAQAQTPIRPDSTKTPGATLAVTVQDICTPGYSHKVRNVPGEVKEQVYESYGIPSHEPGEYEIDHLISLELGGSNSARNLWPESYWTAPWNAHVKDVLENTLHREVCAGRLPLATAQHDIATDWIAAYQKYFHRTAATSAEAAGGLKPAPTHGRQSQAHERHSWPTGHGVDVTPGNAVVQFDNGSAMTVLLGGQPPSISPTGRVRGVRQQGTTLDIDYDSGTTLEFQTAEATQVDDAMVRDAEGTIGVAR